MWEWWASREAWQGLGTEATSATTDSQLVTGGARAGIEPIGAGMTEARPAQIITGPAVVLQGPDLLAVARLLEYGIEKVRTRESSILSPRLMALVEQVHRAANLHRLAAARLGIAPTAALVAASASSRRVVTTAEAAEVTGLSIRQVQSLAPSSFGGEKAGRIWLLDSEAVEAFAARRSKKGSRPR